MKLMRKLTVGLLSASLCLSALASANPFGTDSLLYVVRAKHSQVVKSDGQYQLVMTNPRVSFFADRPARVAGHMPVPQLLKTWSEGKASFAKDHPNAVLLSDVKSATGAKDIERFVTLSQPTYQAKTDKVMITVARLNQTDKALTPMQLANTALFIDGGCNIANPPSGGCW